MRLHVFPVLASFMLAQAPSATPVGPAGDHHQHLFSPAIASMLAPGGGGPQTLTAHDLVSLLNTAGIRRKDCD